MTLQPQQPPERVSYLFGYPIAHSLSPLLHNTVYAGLGLPWQYDLLESTDFTQFLSLLKQPRCFGSAVTMPHKVAIIPYLDDVTEEGREVGACNTIFIREGPDGQRRYIGTNTDVVGIRESFTQNVADPANTYHDRPGLVIGGGGAARSAVYALNKWLRCTSIYIVNRDRAEVDAVISSCQTQGFGSKLIHVSSVEQAEKLEGPGAIVACIPDFAPSTDAEWTARHITETFLNNSHKGAMLEMAYHPKVWTRLAQIAHDAGWQVILGTEAMIWQGLEQDRLWTGKTLEELPVQQVKEAVAAKLDRAGIPWLNEGPLEEPKGLNDTMKTTTTTAIAA